MAQKIVVDANVCIALIIPLAYSDLAAKQWLLWQTHRFQIYAPLLWEYEVVSALRKAIAAGLISKKETEAALQRLMNLGVECHRPDSDLHRSALQWAEDVNQPVAYDSQYLALAEALEADFWTADKRLVDSLKTKKLTWLHWIGEVS
jgi:predicted nucleic acid-binding protein